MFVVFSWLNKTPFHFSQKNPIRDLTRIESFAKETPVVGYMEPFSIIQMFAFWTVELLLVPTKKRGHRRKIERHWIDRWFCFYLSLFNFYKHTNRGMVSLLHILSFLIVSVLLYYITDNLLQFRWFRWVRWTYMCIVLLFAINFFYTGDKKDAAKNLFKLATV